MFEGLQLSRSQFCKTTQRVISQRHFQSHFYICRLFSTCGGQTLNFFNFVSPSSIFLWARASFFFLLSFLESICCSTKVQAGLKPYVRTYPICKKHLSRFMYRFVILIQSSIELRESFAFDAPALRYMPQQFSPFVDAFFTAEWWHRYNPYRKPMEKWYNEVETSQ